MSKSLAVEYRPCSFDEVKEQSATIKILQNQIATNTFKNAYLFVGAAGCGKTTCARIFASEINKGQGIPIEMDAASNNSVEDVREISKMAQTRAIDAEYKIFIIDECHMISVAGWNAMLKLIEEPPAKSIFIFCTTNPEKIPKTILSRVQRYDFQRISTQGIADRLHDILCAEGLVGCDEDSFDEALEYIARLADGGMRDAITMLDKCLSLSDQPTLDNVVQALGMFGVDTFMEMSEHLFSNDRLHLLDDIESVHASGADMKQFIKQYMEFILDLSKYAICETFTYTKLPETKEVKDFVVEYTKDLDVVLDLLDVLVEIDSAIKYSNSAKEYIEIQLMAFME